MKVTVDFDSCASTGACMQVCPEVFEVRNDGYLYILQENPGPQRISPRNLPRGDPPNKYISGLVTLIGSSDDTTRIPSG